MAEAPMYREYATDADKVKVYSLRMKQGEEALDKWAPRARKHWQRYEALQRRTKNNTSSGGHIIQTPLAISNIDSLYSSMTAVEVDVLTTPEGQTTEDQAYIATAALSEEWERCKVQERGSEVTKDALIVGIGYVKVGYEYFEAEQEVPRPNEDIRADVEELLSQADEAGELVNVPDAETIMNSVPVTEKASVVLKDRVVVDYVPWDMLLVDPTAKRWPDVRWVAQKTMVPVHEVRENPLYAEYAKSRRQSKKLAELKPDTIISKDIIGKGDPQEEDQRVTVYTIYDLETGTVCTWAKGSDFLLNEAPNPLALNDDPEDQLPYVPLVLRKTNNRIRGISEMDVLEPLVEERDLYRSRLATYLERSAPKVMAKARTFTQAGKKALEGQETGALVELDEGADVQVDVKDFPMPKLAPEMFNMPALIEQEGRDASGVSELMRGLFPDRKRTATETSEVVTASSGRQAEKRTCLETFYQSIARRMLQYMQMFYEQERIIKFVDDPGDGQWSWSAEDIAAAFGLQVSLTPKEARTWQSRKDDAFAVLNVVGPMLQTQDPATGAPPGHVTELLRYVLTELNIPRRIIRSILALPEEQQQAALSSLQNTAAQAQAQQGVVPDASLIPGPLTGQAVSAAANLGELPPELAAGAGGGNPLSPTAAEAVSESAQPGISTPGVALRVQPKRR